jgi:hypothetical protein
MADLPDLLLRLGYLLVLLVGVVVDRAFLTIIVRVSLLLFVLSSFLENSISS